jgi:hypothetical protein
MFKRKNQWQMHDIYSGRRKNFYLKTRRSFWQKHFYPVGKRGFSFGARLFGGALKGGLTVMISVLMIYGIVQAGSLTPSASPAATSFRLDDIYTRLTTNATSTEANHVFSPGASPAGTLYTLTQIYNVIPTIDATKVLSGASYLGVAGTIANNGAFALTASSSDQSVTAGYYSGGTLAGDIDLVAGKIANAVNIFSVIGTLLGDTDASKVLTTATYAGTYNASALAVGTVKSGTTFGVSLTGEYPSATYTLPNATTTADLAAIGGNISSPNGAVEWWQSDGTRQTATLDFPTLSNICNTDTSNNATGTLSVTAAYLSVGNTWCGTAGTLLANLWNGTNTAGTFPGGSQANGGVDDYNSNGTRPPDTYSKGWTACNAGNSYCGTSDSGADAKDDSTGLIWSMPCNGAGCDSFSDASPLTYSWDNSAANNFSTVQAATSTASGLCTNGDHGQTGWSLPHQKQLMQAYIDGSWGNLEGVILYYWSATTRSVSTTNAWFTNLSGGYTDGSAKTSILYVRCVR